MIQNDSSKHFRSISHQFYNFHLFSLKNSVKDIAQHHKVTKEKTFARHIQSINTMHNLIAEGIYDLKNSLQVFAKLTIKKEKERERGKY